MIEDILDKLRGIYSETSENKEEAKEMLLEGLDIGTKELYNVVWEEILITIKQRMRYITLEKLKKYEKTGVKYIYHDLENHKDCELMTINFSITADVAYDYGVIYGIIEVGGIVYNFNIEELDKMLVNDGFRLFNKKLYSEEEEPSGLPYWRWDPKWGYGPERFLPTIDDVTKDKNKLVEYSLDFTVDIPKLWGKANEQSTEEKTVSDAKSKKKEKKSDSKQK